MTHDTATEAAVQAAAEQLVGFVSRISARGWCDGTAGNFSATVGRDPLRLLITPTGVDKGRVEPEDLVLVGQDGRPLSPATGKPSAEALLHVMIAREARAAAVFHTHSVWATLLGEHFLEQRGFRLSGYEMLKGIDGIDDHEDEIFVPVLENSQDMSPVGEELQRLLQDRPGLRGLLIAGHGLYTWGGSMVEAHRHVEIFEFLFRLVGQRVDLAPFDG